MYNMKKKLTIHKHKTDLQTVNEDTAAVDHRQLIEQLEK